jgi:hypothetical protein
MDTQNNGVCQSKKYDEIKGSDSNKPLNEKEIDELKEIFKNKCHISFIGTYFRKIYDLFINNVTFEPNTNNTDYINDLYYLGVYYQFIYVNYDLMKKYYLMAIEKGNSWAMHNLGWHYQYTEENYNLMKKYYLQAIDKGNAGAMNNLGHYYLCVEYNCDLMKKYFLMAIEKGNFSAMHSLGWHYQYTEENYDLMKKYYFMAINKGSTIPMSDLGRYYELVEHNYDLMKKYYLMAINEGNTFGLVHLNNYYDNNLPNKEDLQNYFNSLIKGNIGFEYFENFNNINIERNGFIDLFCLNIDNNNLKIDDFKFCLSKIVKYININKFCESCESRESCELKNIKHFVRYINKLLYCIKNKSEYKKCVNETFTMYASQIFMEYLDFHYYEYLKKIFVPGGKGYIKTKKHFELIANTIIK